MKLGVTWLGLAGAMTRTVSAASSSSWQASAINEKGGHDSSFSESMMRMVRKNDRTLNADHVPTAFSRFDVQFDQCQFIRAYDDQLAEDPTSETVLATRQFVIFRLCHHGDSGCHYDYGEYAIDMETYLSLTTRYHLQVQTELCEACYNECSGTGGANQNHLLDLNYPVGDAASCDTCFDFCKKVQYMNDNGYLEATEFLLCQIIYVPKSGDSSQILYAGPICDDMGSKIKIGVFRDENCNTLDSTKDVDDYLFDKYGNSLKLSHALLRKSYSQDMPLSCFDQTRGGTTSEESTVVSEVCQQLYLAAAKCETKLGMDIREEESFRNQIEQEQAACAFIESLKSGTYTEDGEIFLVGRDIVITPAGSDSAWTGGQKFAILLFMLGTFVLALIAVRLRSQLATQQHQSKDTDTRDSTRRISYQTVELNELSLSEADD